MNYCVLCVAGLCLVLTMFSLVMFLCLPEMSEGKSTSSRLVACLSTLYLFSKIKADLMVQHATTLQPYLDIKCSVSQSQSLSG